MSNFFRNPWRPPGTFTLGLLLVPTKYFKSIDELWPYEWVYGRTYRWNVTSSCSASPSKSVVLRYCARLWVFQLTVHPVFLSGVDFVQYDLAILTEWSRKYFWGNTELPFFSPAERELLQVVLHVSENSSCSTVMMQVLVSFVCSFCEKPFLRHFAWISSPTANRTYCVNWRDVYFTVKVLVPVETVMHQFRLSVWM